MEKHTEKAIQVTVLAALLLQCTGCGYIMYPDRRGQLGGRVDLGVALMDGLCLLLFVLPGLVAYAVDFSSGTIYIPGTLHGSLDPKDLKVLRFDPNHTSHQDIEKLILLETGVSVKLDQPGTQAVRVDSMNDLMQRFAAADLQVAMK